VVIQVLTREMLSRLAVVLVYVSSLLIWTSFLILPQSSAASTSCSTLESVTLFPALHHRSALAHDADEH
jgi:hypothetical protein